MAETITITSSDVENIIKDYHASHSSLAQIAIEFSGINNIDTLLLLRVMSKKEPDISDIAQVAELMLDGQTITFKNGSEVLYSIAYNRGKGNALHLMFSNKDYLYDKLQETVYALMLKKLTPHLEGSN